MFGRKPDVVTNKSGSVFGSTTISWDDQAKRTTGSVLWKVPRNIRLNDNIVVREDEIAVFYRDGKVLTYFDQPNRYALTDLNAPIVGGLLKFFTGVQQEASVFYIPKRYLDGKFGSAQPYPFTDQTFGLVNLRAFGQYRWKISSPELFINQFVGTFSAETSDDVETRIKEQIVILVYDALGKIKVPVTELAANLTNIEQIVLSTAPDHLGQYGIEINKLSGITISLPEELQQAITEAGSVKAKMTVFGVNYMDYQKGQAIDDAAKNPSGGAGALAGLGVGVGVGAAIGQGMGQSMGYGQGPTRTCLKCAALIPVSTRFCPNCGTEQLQQPQPQPQGTPSQAGAPRFCPNCGAQVVGGTKFCASCGKPL